RTELALQLAQQHAVAVGGAFLEARAGAEVGPQAVDLREVGVQQGSRSLGVPDEVHDSILRSVWERSHRGDPVDGKGPYVVAAVVVRGEAAAVERPRVHDPVAAGALVV